MTRRRRWLDSISLPIIAAACGQGASPAPPPLPAPSLAPEVAIEPTRSTSPPIPVSSVSSAPTAMPSEGVGLRPAPGSYRSETCAPRTYERRVVIGKGTSLTIEERVAPCPEGTPCAWSGILRRSGSYALEGPSELGRPVRLALRLDDATAKSGAMAAPAYLEWYPSRGQLTEPGDTCPYRAPVVEPQAEPAR
ncbi:MAG: hypothetical protein AAF928_07290 [Myxococcota bacterium]